MPFSSLFPSLIFHFPLGQIIPATSAQVIPVHGLWLKAAVTVHGMMSQISKHEWNMVILIHCFYLLLRKEGKQVNNNLGLSIVSFYWKYSLHISHLFFSWCEAKLPHKQELIPWLFEEPHIDQGPTGGIVWLQQSFWPAWSLSSFLPWGWALNCIKAC